MSTTTRKEAAVLDYPDGLNSFEGVRFLATAAGWSGDHLPGICIFGEEMGFSQLTGFVRSSDGRGYYRVTEESCTCPSFMYRGGPCKHQKRLSQVLEERVKADSSPKLPAGVVPLSDRELEARAERISRRNLQRAEERARSPKPSSGRKGFALVEVAA